MSTYNILSTILAAIGLSLGLFYFLRKREYEVQDNKKNLYLSLISKINDIYFSLDLFSFIRFDKKNISDELINKLGNIIKPIREIEKILLDIKPEINSEYFEKFIDKFQKDTNEIIVIIEEARPHLKGINLSKNTTIREKQFLDNVETHCEKIRTAIYNYIKDTHEIAHDLISKELKND